MQNTLGEWGSDQGVKKIKWPLGISLSSIGVVDIQRDPGALFVSCEVEIEAKKTSFKVMVYIKFISIKAGWSGF